MPLKNHFDILRFWLLLKMEAHRSRKGVFMTLVIIFGFMFVAFLLNFVFEDIKVYDEHPGSYASALIIGGFILSSLAFNDLSSTLRRYHYLTLPASTLEKFLSMWALTTAGWILLFSAAFIVYSWAANAIGALMFRNVDFLPFNPLDEGPLKTMKFYFVLQGIFLVGASHYKGYVFPKTLFTLVIFAIICGTLAYFIISDLFLIDEDAVSEPRVLMQMPVYRFWKVAESLFWWALAPLCWTVTYFGLREKEA